MRALVIFSQNHGNQSLVAAHLHTCNDYFSPRLSTRVDIEAYSKKILDNAERFEAWNNQELIGLVATYCNNTEHRRAYITNVSVAPEWQGLGIAKRLLSNCINYLELNGFESLHLEVGVKNRIAIEMYRKLGFKSAKENNSRLELQLGA